MFTRKTVKPSFLDRCFGTLISTALHVSLVMGAALVVVERLVPRVESTGTRLCSFVPQSLGFEQIDRPPDHFGRAFPCSSQLMEGNVGSPGPYLLPPWETIYIDQGEELCYAYIRELRQQFGTLRWVVIPRQSPLRESLPGYAFRKLSLEENRTGMPRLK